MVVLASHCFSVYVTPLWFKNTKDILFNGQGGVVLFFVLSGFVLGASLKNTPLDSRNLGAFYLKRLFRIYPALWAASAVGFTYVMFFHFHSAHPDVSTWFMERFKRERLVPIAFVAALIGALGLLVPPAWSIFNELVGSAVLPFTSRLSFDKPRWGLALAAALALVCVTIGPRTYYGVLFYPLDFQLGVLIAVLFSRHPGLKRPMKIWPLVLTAGVLATGCARGLVLLADPALSQYAPTMHLVEVGGAVAIITAINAGPVSFLRNHLIKSLGDISYSVYLLHFPVMCFVALGLSHVMVRRDLTPVETLILFAFTAAITIGAATVVYKYVELPFIALGRRFAANLNRQAPAAASATTKTGVEAGA
jgi:peptidoglycan/LPS O-acetylase OafA/YrhL